jgi:hypothetical protein
LQQLRSLFKEMLDWDGEALIPVDFVMASALTAYLPGSVEKAWGDLCGPPSSGKSEVLNSLEDGNRRVIVLEDLTGKAFNSGMRDESDPDKRFSVIAQLRHSRPPVGPKILVFPEMGAITNMPREQRRQLFNAIRAAFEGNFRSATGVAGLDPIHDASFALLTGGTEQMDEYRRYDQTLGQRTLTCRVARHTSKYEVRQQIADRAAQTDRMAKHHLKEKIRQKVCVFLDNAISRIKATGGMVQQDESYIHRIGRLGLIVTSLRTVPLSRETYTSLPEGAPRLAQQLVAFGDARVLFDGRNSWTDDDYALVRRIAQDTLPPSFLRALHAMYRGKVENAVKAYPCDRLIRDAQVGPEFYRQIHQWHINDIVDFHHDGVYSIKPGFAADLEYTGFMEGLD